MYLDLTWKIPSLIDLETIIKNNPPVLKNRLKLNIDHFYCILDYLFEASLISDLDNDLGYIPLNAQALQKKVAHNYKEYLTYLIKNGILEQSPTRYQVGGKNIKARSYEFRILFPYLNDQYIKRIPITSEVHKKRKKLAFTERKKKASIVEKRIPSLTKWFNSKLEIDFIRAKRWIDDQSEFNLKMGGVRGYGLGKPKQPLKRIKALHSADRIFKKDFFYNIDTTGSRFHSNLTNLKSELRNFITYDGETLVNIDIKNSQPFFSQLILEPEFYIKSKRKINIYQFPTIFNPLHKINSFKEISNNSPFYFLSYNILEDFLKSPDFQDIKKYKEFVNSGEFYRLLHKEVFEEAKVFDKSEIKKLTFEVMFSSNKFFYQNGSWMDPKTKQHPNAENKRLFAKAFPSVYKVFNEFKKNESGNLAILLQKIESDIILNHIVPRISRERPDLPIFTVHDSVVTTKGNEEYVKSVMIDEIQKLTGLTPHLGIEEWSHPSQEDSRSTNSSKGYTAVVKI